jgi:tetrahydromethanopterin S-methyltransferase subunit G
MFDSIYTALTATGSSALASVLTCLIMRWIMRHDEEARLKSEAELSAAREARLSKIEEGLKQVVAALQQHVQADSGNPSPDDLRLINSRLDKIDDCNSRTTEALGKLEGMLTSNQTWLQNMNNTLQKHVTNLEIHGK